MSSPMKRPRRPPAGAAVRLAETNLPLHLALAWLLIRALPLNPDRILSNLYSAGFVSSILQLVAREILEVGDVAASFDGLRNEVDGLVKRETTSIARLNEKLQSRGQNVPKDRLDAGVFESWMQTFALTFDDIANGCAFLDTLEKELQDRINEDDDADLTEVPEPIERRSLIGIFARSLLLTLRKLSFSDTSHLSQQVSRWCGSIDAGPSSHGHLSSLSRKLAMEDNVCKREISLRAFEKARDRGDYSGALQGLRRFYDYQFPTAGRGQHQHALLNLASFHYSTGGIESAQSALDEAIRVARSEGDRLCLRHCMSLRRRIVTETGSSAFESSELVRIRQAPLPESRLVKASSPMDEIWSIKAALDLGEPVHVAMRRTHLALARHQETSIRSEDKRETKGGWTTEYPFDEGAWHATQAGMWAMLGCTELAELHEEMTLDVSEGDADARLTVLLSRAERAVGQARHDAALAMILRADAVEDMSIHAYHRWATMVWSILERQAESSGDVRALGIVTALRPDASLTSQLGPGGPQRELVAPATPREGISTLPPHVRATLRKAQKLQASNTPPHLVLSHVLSSIQLSAELGYWPVYRLGTVTFAEVLMSMEGQKMGKKALDEVGSIWDEVDDEETRAKGYLVMAKAKVDVALDAEDMTAMGDAITLLRQGLESAEKLGSRALQLECLTLLYLIGDLTRRAQPDDLDRWQEVKQGNEAELSLARDQIRRIGEIVKLVGVRVAEGWE